MDVSITNSFDEITLNKSSLVENFSNSLIGILQDKNYGEVVKNIFIEFNCISMGKSFESGLVVGYDFFQKKKALEISVKVNNESLKNSTDDNFHLIGL